MNNVTISNNVVNGSIIKAILVDGLVRVDLVEGSGVSVVESFPSIELQFKSVILSLLEGFLINRFDFNGGSGGEGNKGEEFHICVLVY